MSLLAPGYGKLNARMKRKPLRKVDPIEHQIELALKPGGFIGDRSCFSFVSGLEEVAANITLAMCPTRGQWR
jgi:hypothetical protein